MRKQVKIEKIICFIMLAASVACFIFALGLTTDIYNLLFVEDFDVEGYELYYDIQPFNKNLVQMCIISIVLSVFLFITKTHSRRKYYISNYIIIGVIFVFNIVLAVWGISQISYYKEWFLTNVDFEGWEFVTTIIGNIKYTESTFWLDASTVTLVLLIIVSVIMVLNLTWKIMLMKYEDNILKENTLIKEEVQL